MVRDPQRRRDLLVGRSLGRPQRDLTPFYQPARGYRAGCLLAQPRLIFAGQYGTRSEAVFSLALKVVADGWRPCHKAGPGVQAKTNHPL